MDESNFADYHPMPPKVIFSGQRSTQRLSDQMRIDSGQEIAEFPENVLLSDQRVQQYQSLGFEGESSRSIQRVQFLQSEQSHLVNSGGHVSSTQSFVLQADEPP